MMKVLIIEDLEQKAKDLKECVESCGVEVEVSIVTSAHRAFEFIINTMPALVILDVLIPFVEGGKPTDEASVWLVKELPRKLDRTKIPLVVGATQFPDAKRKVEDDFAQYLWNVVVVDGDSSDWKKWISYAVKYQASVARLEAFVGKGKRCDAAIVAALRMPEFVAAIDSFGSGERLIIEESFENWMICKILDNAHTEHDVVIACADEMGMSAMAALTTRVCMLLKPRILLLTGIMGGNKEHVGLSDLIAIEETWDCRAGKLTERGFLPDVKVCRCSIPLRNLARSIFDEDYFLNLLKGWNGERKYIPKFRSGAVACSPSVLAVDGAFDELAKQKRKVLGVEMEGFGCYFAAEQMGTAAPRVLGLKSVCDLGDKTKNDDLHRLSAYISANSIKALLSEAKLWAEDSK